MSVVSKNLSVMCTRRWRRALAWERNDSSADKPGPVLTARQSDGLEQPDARGRLRAVSTHRRGWRLPTVRGRVPRTTRTGRRWRPGRRLAAQTQRLPVLDARCWQRPRGSAELRARQLRAPFHRCLVVLQLLHVQPQRTLLPGRRRRRAQAIARRSRVEVMDGESILAQTRRDEDSSSTCRTRRFNVRRLQQAASWVGTKRCNSRTNIFAFFSTEFRQTVVIFLRAQNFNFCLLISSK